MPSKTPRPSRPHRRRAEEIKQRIADLGLLSDPETRAIMNDGSKTPRDNLAALRDKVMAKILKFEASEAHSPNEVLDSVKIRCRAARRTPSGMLDSRYAMGRNSPMGRAGSRRMSASSSSRVLLMGALAAASVGCGGAQSVGSRGGAAWHVIQFKGAALPAMRSNGQPWHTRAGDDNSLLGGLIGLAVGYPAVGVMLGSAMSTDATTEAPAPFLELKIAGDTYAMSPTGQSLAPRWQQPIAIPHGRYPARTMALIQLRDAMDQSVLGQRELTVAELLSPGARTLTDIGEVRSLDVEVQDLPPRGTATIELRVPADRSLEALTKGVDESWTPVPVWNGDRISISAKGKVCPSSDGSVCFGPEGAEPDQWRSYNYREFADERHASLVAILPGQTEGVGAAASFVVRQSGFMLLFVNDTDEGNNEGLLDVIVTIEPAHR